MHPVMRTTCLWVCSIVSANDWLSVMAISHADILAYMDCISLKYRVENRSSYCSTLLLKQHVIPDLDEGRHFLHIAYPAMRIWDLISAKKAIQQIATDLQATISSAQHKPASGPNAPVPCLGQPRCSIPLHKQVAKQSVSWHLPTFNTSASSLLQDF